MEIHALVVARLGTLDGGREGHFGGLRLGAGGAGRRGRDERGQGGRRLGADLLTRREAPVAEIASLFAFRSAFATLAERRAIRARGALAAIRAIRALGTIRALGPLAAHLADRALFIGLRLRLGLVMRLWLRLHEMRLRLRRLKDRLREAFRQGSETVGQSGEIVVVLQLDFGLHRSAAKAVGLLLRLLRGGDQPKIMLGVLKQNSPP